MVIKRLIIALAILLTILMIWTIWGNTALELNKYVIESEKIPKAFDGYKIAQISDLHNAEIGAENEELLAMIEAADPDIIAITGDMIDSRRTNVEVALGFAEKAVKLAPCYYANGNHELRVSEYDGGLYIKEETNMIVSRGIGNSLFPLRFNNRPEVVLIELQAR